MTFSLLEIAEKMGWVARGVVLVLVLMSIGAIGIAVERFLASRRRRALSIGYIGVLQPLVATPGRLREAVGLQQRWLGSPLARIIGAGIDEFAHGLHMLEHLALDAEEVEVVVDGV